MIQKCAKASKISVVSGVIGCLILMFLATELFGYYGGTFYGILVVSVLVVSMTAVALVCLAFQVMGEILENQKQIQLQLKKMEEIEKSRKNK